MLYTRGLGGVSRRRFVRGAGGLLGLGALTALGSACQQAPATPQVVTKEVIVEKPVERVVTQIVEKPVEKVVERSVIVTATPNQKFAGKISFLAFDFFGYGLVKKDWAADFRLSHPQAQVDLMLAGVGPASERLNTMVAAGTPPDIYDVRQGNNAMLTNLPIVRPLTDYLKRDAGEVKVEDIYPQALEPCHYKGQLLMFPDHPTSTLLTYNKTLFEKDKVPFPTNDWTREQATQMLAPLSKKGPDGKPIQWARSLERGSDGLWLQTMWEHGTDFVSEDWSKTGFHSPEGVAALQFLYDQVHTAGLAPGPGQDIQGGFPGGAYGASWAFHSYNWPDIINAKVSFDVAVPPKGPAGRGIRRVVNTNAITKGSKNPDLAWEFMKFFNSTEQRIKSAAIGMPPVRKSAAQAVWLKDAPANRKSDPRSVENFFLSLEQSRVPMLLPNLAEYTDKVLAAPIGLMWEKKLTPAEAAKQAGDATMAWLKTQKRPD